MKVIRLAQLSKRGLYVGMHSLRTLPESGDAGSLGKRRRTPWGVGECGSIDFQLRSATKIPVYPRACNLLVPVQD